MDDHRSPALTDVSAAQVEAMELAVERLLSEARATACRVGLEETAALVVLEHTLAAAIADECGPRADAGILRKASRLAATDLSRLIPAYHRERTVRPRGRPHV